MPSLPSLPSMSPLSWALVYFAAAMIGVSKTGLPGIGIIGVGLFALVLRPLDAVGSVLLLLIGADIIAVSSNRRNAEWKYLWKLFPPTAAGVILGTIVMKWLSTMAGSEKLLQVLIGAILLLLVVFQLIQRSRGKKPEGTEEMEMSPLISVGTGILAGFTTMVANASGPIMVLYFLAMRLPKVAFIGTAAWFFFVVNLFKVPFGIYLGTVSFSGLFLALALFPGALVGGLFGRWLLHRIDQKWFEGLAIVFTLLAGLRLCLLNLH